MSELEERKLPLDGLGIAVTRAEALGGPLSRRLAVLGARVLRWQALEIVPPADPEPLAAAVASLATYDWIVFTSANAITALTAVLAGRLIATPVLAVGPATAAVAERAGFRVHRVAETCGAAGLVASLRTSGEVAGARVLLPASALAGPELAAELTTLGAAVDRIVAYRARPTPLDAVRCRAQLAAGEVAAITFTSPSAVASLARTFGEENLAFALRGVRIVSIGPTTSRAIGDHGLEPTAQAAPSTLDGVAAATIAAVE